jgi:predicted small lipoprotein YifL
MRTLSAVRWMLILAVAAAAGCGQKGPLYLPQHKTKVVTHSSSSSSSSSAASASQTSSSSSSTP